VRAWEVTSTEMPSRSNLSTSGPSSARITCASTIGEGRDQTHECELATGQLETWSTYTTRSLSERLPDVMRSNNRRWASATRSHP